MAHHPSAIRQHRRSQRRNTINKKNKTALRTQIKKIRGLIEAREKDEAGKLLPHVFKTIDQTVKKGAIHRNTGARHKSRLSRRVEMIAPPPAK